jgi:3-dehydroquinate dehydratase-2
MRVLVLQGPNLNRLGAREPEVYGSATLGELERSIDSWAGKLGVEASHFQSNHEGALIEALHASDHDGIVFNPGALTHTSRAIADAVASLTQPVVEVHISNIAEREPWRAHSVLVDVAAWSIYGRGPAGYRDALRHLVNRARVDFETISYGPHDQQVGDLRRGGSDLAVLIHGGFWRGEWARDTMESLAIDLTERGVSTWNIEYRRLGAGGGWPGSGHDVRMAIETVPQLPVPAGRVTLIGHSAGGYLALWAAGKIDVDLVVALAPVTDLAKHAMRGSHGSPEARQLIDSGAPTLAYPGDTPLTVLHGSYDDQVAIQQSEELAARLGVEVTRVESSHFELLDPSRNPWKNTARAIAGT